ncbi:hypothetical protein MPH_09765 [Macrophomina phaseolina MS6]|uniref:Rhodopsin domain-containing protein n=1 Tax=Macrophomina phaseolina (strain MS6) TaxID=1126212 RepID=K2RS89_MACPH|nr:hypothetical protein MPH_09765 [Macrophomina phaseolina MS6]
MSVYLKRQSGSDSVADGSGLDQFPESYVSFNNKAEILSITGVFCALAAVVVMLRIYVRAVMLKFVGPDDWVMFLAMALSIVTLVCFVQETEHGLGKHAVVMVTDVHHYTEFSKWLYAHSVIVMVAVSSVKISIALFLMRLAQRTRNVKFLWGMIAFLIAFTLSCMGTLIFQCTPVAAAWDFSLRPPTGSAKCFAMDTFRNIGMFNSIVNILTDFLFASLPVPLIWKLKVNMRTKLTLIITLSLGYFASAAAIVKCVLQWNVLSDPDWTVHDSFNVWNYIELCIGIIAGSLPALKPLFNWFLETARAITSSGGRTGARRPSGYNGYGSAGFGYLKQPDSSSYALASLSRSRGDAENPKVDPYVAEISVGGHERATVVSTLDKGLHLTSKGSRESSGSTSKASKEGEKDWDLDARKTSGDGILPQDGETGRPRGHVILRTTEVHVS